MQADDLPSPREILACAREEVDRAYRALGDATDWLRSDWRSGTTMTTAQTAERDAIQGAIRTAKEALAQIRRRY